MKVSYVNEQFQQNLTHFETIKARVCCLLSIFCSLKSFRVAAIWSASGDHQVFFYRPYAFVCAYSSSSKPYALLFEDLSTEIGNFGQALAVFNLEQTLLQLNIKNDIHT